MRWPSFIPPLTRKLMRQIWQVRGQALAITGVITAGITVFIMMNGALLSLSNTRDAYFDRYRFPDMFAPVKRAPITILEDIRSLDDVQAVEDRITGAVLVNLGDQRAAISGKLFSVPEGRRPRVSDLVLVKGNWVSQSRPDDVIVLRDFALTNELDIGSTLNVTIQGQRRNLRIVGLALSPEFIYPIPPGELMPDDKRFAVLWMGRDAIEQAYDLSGAFNEVLITAEQGANLDQLEQELDLLLDPWGSFGPYPAADQLSNRFLTQEIEQLEVMSRILPTIFLGVAAFLVNMTINRMVEAEREQIGLLKAFGFSDSAIAVHYIMFAFMLVGIGILCGFISGNMMGRGLSSLYGEYFKFPIFIFTGGVSSYVISGALGLAAGMIGAINAVRKTLRLTPAVAMRPPVPTNYGRNAVARVLIGLKGLDQPSRLILRHLARWPRRALLTCLGIAMAMGIRVAAEQMWDAIDLMMVSAYDRDNPYDAEVNLIDPTDISVLNDIARMPGVLKAEPFRAVPGKLRAGLQTEELSLIGLAPSGNLRRFFNLDNQQFPFPEEGMVLTVTLAEKLNLHVGDIVWFEASIGKKPRVALPIVSIRDAYFGASAYVSLRSLNRMMGEPDWITGATLEIDPTQADTLNRELKDIPTVAGVTFQNDARVATNKTMDEFLGPMTFFNTLFSSLIAVGIVYSSARISFAERSRELATLRVLGFSMWEVAYILLGELLILIVLALPIGALLGHILAYGVVSSANSDLFRIPFVISKETIATGVAVIAGSAILSGILILRQIRGLALVEALKTRD